MILASNSFVHLLCTESCFHCLKMRILLSALASQCLFICVSFECERERRKFLIYWFTPQMPAAARPKPGLPLSVRDQTMLGLAAPLLECA